jgi:hypothetical protein
MAKLSHSKKGNTLHHLDCDGTAVLRGDRETDLGEIGELLRNCKNTPRELRGVELNPARQRC